MPDPFCSSFFTFGAHFSSGIPRRKPFLLLPALAARLNAGRSSIKNPSLQPSSVTFYPEKSGKHLGKILTLSCLFLTPSCHSRKKTKKTHRTFIYQALRGVGRTGFEPVKA